MSPVVIVLSGDVGGRDDLVLTVERSNGTVVELKRVSWEDVGTAGLNAVTDLTYAFGRALNIEVRDKTT